MVLSHPCCKMLWFSLVLSQQVMSLRYVGDLADLVENVMCAADSRSVNWMWLRIWGRMDLCFRCPECLLLLGPPLILLYLLQTRCLRDPCEQDRAGAGYNAAVRVLQAMMDESKEAGRLLWW